MAKSLAAQSGALTAPLTLPSVFQAPQERVTSSFSSPYFTFAHPKRADEWTKIRTKYNDIAEGDMVLVAGGDVYKFTTAKVGWLCGRQYWAEVSPTGEILRASMQERPKPYKEHIESVLLVYLDDKIIPANAAFRSTKCPGAKTLADAFIEAGEVSWADRSPAHRETLAATQPFMRFYGELTLSPQRTSKSSGMVYRTTVCSIKPTGTQEWRLLKALCENGDTQKILDDAARRFESRMADVTTKAA